jgi:hypothetical protein
MYVMAETKTQSGYIYFLEVNNLILTFLSQSSR